MSSSVARGCEKNRKSSINFVNPLVCAPDPLYNIEYQHLYKEAT